MLVLFWRLCLYLDGLCYVVSCIVLVIGLEVVNVFALLAGVVV